MVAKQMKRNGWIRDVSGGRTEGVFEGVGMEMMKQRDQDYTWILSVSLYKCHLYGWGRQEQVQI